MLRHVSGLVVLTLLLGAALISPATAVPTRAQADRVVCLSPGHGDGDTGATNGDLTERDLNWTIATKLAGLLSPEYTVVYTHENASQNPDGTARAQECNRQGADTVLWIHLNSSSDPRVDYFKAFWGKKRKDEAFCQTLTNAFDLSLPYSTSPLPKQPVGQFASSVMLKSNAPACLVENVFLSNTDEGKMFRDPELPDVREGQIAQQLYEGLVAWYTR